LPLPATLICVAIIVHIRHSLLGQV
jgi:hypothetical protein